MRQDPATQGTYRLPDKGTHAPPPTSARGARDEAEALYSPSDGTAFSFFSIEPRQDSETVLKLVIALWMTYES